MVPLLFIYWRLLIMGQSQTAKYETDAGTVVRIRISPASLAVAGNTEPAGAIDDERIFAYASNPGSRRGGQLNARGLRMQRFLGAGLARKRLTTFIPILTQTALDTFTINQEITIGGNAYTVADKISEA